MRIFYWKYPVIAIIFVRNITNTDKSMMALISSHQRKTFVFLWLGGGKTQPWVALLIFSPIVPLFSSSLDFQISTVLSEDVCLKVFVTKSWRIYEIVQKYNFHLCRLFATGVRGGGSTFVWEFNIPPKAEDNICYGRAGLGSLLKSGVLLDPSLLLRVMNFTSALNPTERYIYWVPSPLHV